MKKLLLLFFIVIGCAGPSIIDRPIDFNEKRESLSLQYMKERYDITKDKPEIAPLMIVVHWTAIPDLEKSFNAFKDAELPGHRNEISGAGSLNVSAHFLVDRDGIIYRLMPETLMARHVIGLNHTAIGIENVGGPDARLTNKQLKANAKLVRYLKKKYDIIYLIGHYEYRLFEDHELWREVDEDYRTRKTDPGKEFMFRLRQELNDLEFKPLPDEN